MSRVGLAVQVEQGRVEQRRVKQGRSSRVGSSRVGSSRVGSSGVGSSRIGRAGLVVQRQIRLSVRVGWVRDRLDRAGFSWVGLDQ